MDDTSITADDNAKKKGGRKGWATAEQESWLRERMNDYQTGQGRGGRGLVAFWGPVFEGWFQHWPEGVEGMVEGSSAYMEAVDAKKKVSHCLKKNARLTLTVCCQRIKQWFNNHSRSGSTSGTTQKLIDLKGKRTRKLQMTQMYSRMFWEEKIKPIAEERWCAHLALHPELVFKRGIPLAFRNDVIKELFEKEPAEVKAEVARRRDEEVSDEETGADEDDNHAGADSDGQKRQAKALSYQR
jgi:hypothetical protein